MGVIKVCVETLGGCAVFGPQEVDAGLTVGKLKALFEPERPKRLLDKSTFQELNDGDALPAHSPELFLMIQWVVAPEPQPDTDMEEEREQILLPWERKLAETLEVGDVCGND